MVVMIGIGLWKWCIFDYLDCKNYDWFDELVSQIV